MPVVGTPAVNPYAPSISRDDARLFLRDYAGNNILLDDVQFTDDEISKAIDMAVDEWNLINPISYDKAGQIPKSVLLLGTAAWLMRSESFLQLRNQASYQDADVAPIGMDDKHQFYDALSRQLKDEWKATARGYKTQRNLERGYGSLSSGYRNVGRFHTS